MGVDSGGGTDVGGADEFLDDNEFDVLFEEEGGRRVAKVVEPDAAQGGPAEQGVEVPGESGPLDRGAVGPGEDVATGLPAGPRRFTFLVLPVAVPCERASAGTRWARQCVVRSSGSWWAARSGRRCWCVGGCGGCWRFRRPGRSSQRRPRSSPLRSAQGEFEQRAQPVPVGGSEERAGFFGGEGFESAGTGCAHPDVAGHVAQDLLLPDGVLQSRLEYGVDAGQRQRGQALGAALPDGTPPRLVASGRPVFTLGESARKPKPMLRISRVRRSCPSPSGTRISLV